MAHYKKIVVLTGAGVSVASGLPPYRGEGGVWEKHDVAKIATREALKAEPNRVWAFFADARRAIARAEPNESHYALARAEELLSARQTLTIITQNVDGLHQRAGSTRVVELHGSLRRTICTECDYEQPEKLDVVQDDCPACPRCASSLRPGVTLFGEPMAASAEWEAKKALRGCDLFLAVGTSGTVFPAANFVRSAEYEGARTLYVNTAPMDSPHPAFQESLLGPAEELLPQILF